MALFQGVTLFHLGLEMVTDRHVDTRRCGARRSRCTRVRWIDDDRGFPVGFCRRFFFCNEETLSLLAMSSLLAQALNSFKSAAVAAHASALAPGQPAGGQGLEDFLSHPPSPIFLAFLSRSAPAPVSAPAPRAF